MIVDVVDLPFFRYEYDDYCRNKMYLEDFAAKSGDFLKLFDKEIRKKFDRKSLGYSVDYTTDFLATMLVDYMLLLEYERWIYKNYSCEVCYNTVDYIYSPLYTKFGVKRVIDCLRCKFKDRRVEKYIESLGWSLEPIEGIKEMCIQDTVSSRNYVKLTISLNKNGNTKARFGLITAPSPAAFQPCSTYNYTYNTVYYGNTIKQSIDNIYNFYSFLNLLSNNSLLDLERISDSTFSVVFKLHTFNEGPTSVYLCDLFYKICEEFNTGAEWVVTKSGCEVVDNCPCKSPIFTVKI